MLPVAPPTPPGAAYAPGGSPPAESIDGAAPPASVGAAPEAPAATAAGSALDVPRDTTPTFELEMLVSGAVLFGLFQFVPLVDALGERIEPHYGLLGIVLSAGVGLLGISALYALIGCFVVHLALRGWWVAMVGVHSVFPQGVRWERMKEAGPITRALYERRLRPLPQSITRVDNAASLVFATGFVLALGTLSSCLIVAAGGVIAWGVVQLGAPRPELIVMGTVVGLGLLLGAAPYVDYRFGSRLRGRPAALLRALIAAMVRTQPASGSSLQAVLTTNVDKRIAYGVLLGGITVALATVSFPRLSDAEVPGAGTYAYFADESETRALHAHFYESLRGPKASARAPSIQSEVIEGPYVRLFVPYVTLRHNEAMRRACPGLRPLEDEDVETAAGAAAADAVLRCALTVHRPALDGRPLDRHGFRFFANPRSQRRGFLMLIPTAGLAPGEHRLTVWPAPRPGGRANRTPWVIPFWR